MINRFIWPSFDKDQLFRMNKVVNEHDFWPLLFIRQLAQTVGFLRKSKGHFRAAPLGREAITEVNLPVLQALLFHVTMWQIDLRDFGSGIHGRWPQGDVSVVLWSLSVAANDWQSPERLTRLCTIPNNSVLAAEWDSSSMMMEARILRPLHWFGLLDHKQEAIEGRPFGERRFYRKTGLFDRFLSFDVKTEASGAMGLPQTGDRPGSAGVDSTLAGMASEIDRVEVSQPNPVADQGVAPCPLNLMNNSG
jgi:hypothetical protein